MTRRREPQKQTISAPKSARLLLAASGGAVILLTAIAHGPALKSGAICFDDHQYFLENPLVQNPCGRSGWRFLSEVSRPSTVEGYYQPLTMISLMLDVAAGATRKNFEPFHRTSLLLHVLNSFLIFLLVYRIWKGAAPAILAAILFGVHPLTVEPIPWIGERKTLLAAFFALCCFHCYLSHVRGLGRWNYLAAWFVALLAMMSKPTTTPLPVLLVILDYWPLGRPVLKNLPEKIPFFILGGVFAVITVISQANTSSATMPTDRPALFVPLTLCHNIVFYLQKMVWPSKLSSHYPFPDPMTVSQPMLLIGVIGTATLFTALFLSLRKTRAIAAGWVFFFLAILPTMQIIGFSDVIASDKYAYLPSVGIVLVVGWALTAAFKTGRPLRYATLTACVLAVALEVRATRQTYGHWRNTESRYAYMLSLTPQAATLHNNLAVALLEEGRTEDAISHYKKALTLKPGTDETYTNIGLALVRQGRVADAFSLYQNVLARFPRSYSIHSNFGALLADQQRYDEAIPHYRTAIERKPNRIEPHVNLANALAALGRQDEARAEFKLALELAPRSPQVHNAFAVALSEMGQVEEALEHFNRAIELDGSFPDAHRNVAIVLGRSGQTQDAIRACRTAIALAPNDAECHLLMAQLLADSGDRGGAIRAAGKALHIDPNLSDARQLVEEMSGMPATVTPSGPGR